MDELTRLKQLSEIENLTEANLQRQHFEWIADTIGGILGDVKVPRAKAESIAAQLAMELRTTNEMFNEEKFIQRFFKSFITKDNKE